MKKTFYTVAEQKAIKAVAVDAFVKTLEDAKINKDNEKHDRRNAVQRAMFEALEILSYNELISTIEFNSLYKFITAIEG